jgi:MoxR-like ATPase
MKKPPPQPPRLAGHLNDSLKASSEKYLKKNSPSEGMSENPYAYGEGLAEDAIILEDLLSSRDGQSLPYERAIRSEILEPTIRLAGFSQRLPNLVKPKSEVVSIEEYIKSNQDEIFTIIPYELLPPEEEEETQTDGVQLGDINLAYAPKHLGFQALGNPAEMITKLEKVGYHAGAFIAIQLSLMFQTRSAIVRSFLLEGPPGCGKSFLAKCVAKLAGAELMVLTCYPGMNTQFLIEQPSPIGLARAMAGTSVSDEDLVNLGILSRAFLASQTKPVVLLVDELDKVDTAVDTFFLGPLNDGIIYTESRPPIVADRDNLVVMFTKNFNREIDDALMRRVNPLTMTYLDTTAEKRVLKGATSSQISANLSYLVEFMRGCQGHYQFERPPAPEELQRSGRYLDMLLEWGITDFEVVGRTLWPLMAKSERDRTVFEQLIRFHPEFADSLIPDPRKATFKQLHAKLGRIALKGVIEDPDRLKRKKAFQVDKVGWQHLGTPEKITEKLARVGYECLPYLAKQVGLICAVKRDMVRSLLLEGPPGCGKSFLGKQLARIAGAEFMTLQCYTGMDTRNLIETRNEVAIARASAGVRIRKSDVIELGVLSQAFLRSQSQPVMLLIDEIDKVDGHIDTFFLGPIQDGRIWLQSGPPIDCNLDNLFLIFTKNYERELNDALMRRIVPLTMTYLDSTLERKVLSRDCIPRLISNLVYLADIMRSSRDSFRFDRPPAPEELLTTARYIIKLIEWGHDDLAEIGFQIWRMIAKSSRDRLVLEHLLRYHPEFLDEDYINPADEPMESIQRKLGTLLLRGIIGPDTGRAH